MNTKILLQTLLTILFLTTTFSLIAQIEVNGIIVNEDEPMIGATVLIKNTTTGVLTDENGAFTIMAQKNDVLIINYLGFESLEIELEDRSELSIDLGNLNLAPLQLADIIVCCNCFVSESVRSGLTINFRGEDIRHQEVTSVEQFISAAIPTLQYDLIFRGEKPLIVLDGVPLLFPSDDGIMVNTPNPLQLLNVNEIDQVTFMPAFTARNIFSHSTGGIILIRTKSTKEPGSHWEVDTKWGSMNTSFGLAGDGIIAEPLWLQDQHVAFKHWSKNTQIRFSGAFRKLGGNKQTGFTTGQSRLSVSQSLLRDKLNLNMNLAGAMVRGNVMDQQTESSSINTNPFMGKLQASMDITQRLDGSINLFANNWGIWEKGGLARVNYARNLGRHYLNAVAMLSHRNAQLTGHSNWQAKAASALVSWEYSDWVDVNALARQEINQIPEIAEKEWGNFLSADFRTRLNPDISCSPTRASLLASVSRRQSNYRSSQLMTAGIVIDPFYDNLVELEVRYLHSSSENNISIPEPLNSPATFFAGLPGKIQNRAWTATLRTSLPYNSKLDWDMALHLTANTFRTQDQAGQLAKMMGVLPRFAYGMQHNINVGSFSFSGIVEGLAKEGFWDRRHSLIRLQQSVLSYHFRRKVGKMFRNIQFNLSAQNIPLISRNAEQTINAFNIYKNQGQAYMAFPQPRGILAGLNIGLI